jgi:SAM-dependent methyltransferase
MDCRFATESLKTIRRCDRGPGSNPDEQGGSLSSVQIGGGVRPIRRSPGTGARKRKIALPGLALPQEIAIDFTSYDQWMEWVGLNGHVLDPDFWTGIASAIRAKGFIEPLTGIRIAPDQIEDYGGQLREGLAVRGINARVRAVMRLIEYQVNMESWLNLRIFAPEAVTPLALKLRGVFPRFIGSEYASDATLREAMYPIPFEDLTSLSFQDRIFDLVTTNEVLEHVPDIDAALREIRRVLKPGAWHVGTHPFMCFGRQSERRARLTESGVEHLKSPEYHGNPFEAGGSLVFETPGWDILQRCYDAGFSYAAMHYCISQRHGYVSEDIGGIFVLCCQR